MKNILTSVSLALLLFSCSNNDEPKNSTLDNDSTSVTASNKNLINQKEDYFIIGKDSIAIQPFEIKVALSPKAEQRMKEGKETIIVYVFLTGTPKDSAGAELEEDGSFFVASAEKEILPGQVAKFDGIQFPKKIYD